MNMLNIGCGAIFHRDWINVDLGAGSNVTSHDVRKGLPFPDRAFEVVYHSHLLEHIPHENALLFTEECFRVLKPGGIIRILVPDLEQIARLYLDKLSTAKESEADYDWIMLELYDQCIREKSGGLMECYLRNLDEGMSPFVSARMGGTAALYSEHTKGTLADINPTRQSLARLLYKLRIEAAKWMLYAITGENGRNAFKEGLFRNTGEVHRWMYDRFSLGRLMANAGFAEMLIVSASVSSIPDFARYKLDVIDGVVRKPDSLVMEGKKP
jgi:predicted SAM-dependent methyltransferase